MKIRSYALYHYLLQANVLGGSEEAILQAKKAYRAAYKKQWKQQARPQKEIRFTLTIKQFFDLKAKAQSMALRHTSYVKALALTSIDQPTILDPRLLEVLQLISMTTIATSHDKHTERVHTLLEQAETILLQYLKH